MQILFNLRYDPPANQRVFWFENDALGSVEVRVAEAVKAIWGMGMANRLGMDLPMLPTPAIPGWRSAPHEDRAHLQNTFQTSAIAMDLGISRYNLALFRSFRHFQLAAREAVRYFDIRVGPPWWVLDREYLEMAYTAVMHQEETDDEINACVESYWGEVPDGTPYWVAQCYMDWVHAGHASIIDMARYHVWERGQIGGKLLRGYTLEEAKALLLINWQVTHQPRIAIEDWSDTEWESPKARTLMRENTFTHRHALRRLIRALNAKPRGRPQRTLCHS